MKRLFGIFLLLMCSGLMLMPPAYASARNPTRIELQKQVAQLKKELLQQADFAEKERYAHAERVRALEVKYSKVDQSRKFNQYSYSFP